MKEDSNIAVTEKKKTVVQIIDEKTNLKTRVEITDGNDNKKVFYRVNKKQKNKKKRPNDDPEHPQQPGPNQCHYFVKRKNRYCHLIAKKGKLYCGEHAVFDPENQERIPCPYDNAHSVVKKDLEKHLERCNSRPKPKDECFVENCNIRDMAALEKTREKTPREELKEMSKEDFDKFVERILNAYNDAFKDYEIPTEILDHEALNERKIETHGGKHAVQQASILGHLAKINSLKKEDVYVEFGAGKGELTYYVRKAVGDPSTYVLIDRRNFRMKFDRENKNKKKGKKENAENNEESSTSIATTPNETSTETVATEDEKSLTIQKRLYMDIKDLCLAKLSLLHHKKLVAVSKHLCGCATDLTLKCLVNYTDTVPNSVKSIFIALCCHQICNYGMYCNPDYLTHYGFNQEDFEKICVLTTWATCGKRVSKSEKTGGGENEKESKADDDDDEEEEEEEEEDDDEEKAKKELLKKSELEEDGNDNPNEPHWSGMSFDDRTVFGRKCKRFLDMGRVQFLRAHGYQNVRLVHYVTQKYSLENCALIVNNM
jgi:tRNA:m4X modification enzyme